MIDLSLLTPCDQCGETEIEYFHNCNICDNFFCEDCFNYHLDMHKGLFDFKGYEIIVRPDDSFPNMEFHSGWIGQNIHRKSKHNTGKKDKIFAESRSSLDYTFACFPEATVYLSLSKPKKVVTEDFEILIHERFWRDYNAIQK